MNRFFLQLFALGSSLAFTSQTWAGSVVVVTGDSTQAVPISPLALFMTVGCLAVATYAVLRKRGLSRLIMVAASVAIGAAGLAVEKDSAASLPVISLTMTDGSSSLNVAFCQNTTYSLTAKNNASVPVKISRVLYLPSNSEVGQVLSPQAGDCGAGTVLAPLASCTIQVLITTPGDGGECV